MGKQLTYETLERIHPPRPVDRLAFIADACRGQRVLDIGCLDETALAKRDTEHWLHGRIAAVAASVVGVDFSSQIPDTGLITAPNAAIYRGDGIDPQVAALDDGAIDIITAGEFIEHIEQPLAFFAAMKRRFPGRELIISTPNGLALANSLLGLAGGEAQHPDHIHLFTYKVLNTLCLRAGFTDYQIIPYRFYATELLMGSRGAKRLAVALAERMVRVGEWCFPLLSFGYVVRIRL